MLKLLVLLQLAVLRHEPVYLTRLTSPGGRRRDRGSVTTEHVLWAVAVIAIVGIVVAAVTSYVKSQAGNIK